MLFALAEISIAIKPISLKLTAAGGPPAKYGTSPKRYGKKYLQTDPFGQVVIHSPLGDLRNDLQLDGSIVTLVEDPSED
jgi:hypothetical protein